MKHKRLILRHYLILPEKMSRIIQVRASVAAVEVHGIQQSVINLNPQNFGEVACPFYIWNFTQVKQKCIIL